MFEFCREVQLQITRNYTAIIRNYVARCRDATCCFTLSNHRIVSRWRSIDKRNEQQDRESDVNRQVSGSLEELSRHGYRAIYAA